MSLGEILLWSGPVGYFIGWFVVFLAWFLDVSNDLLAMLIAWAVIPWGCVMQSGIGAGLLALGL
jgi:hypothetical protein